MALSNIFAEATRTTRKQLGLTNDNSNITNPSQQVAITASGAVDPHNSGNYIITKAGVAALTVAAPTSTTDDGVRISIISNTAFAHTVTATGLLNSGSASVNVATFAAFAGAGVILVAYQGKWLAEPIVGITFS